MNTDDIHTNFCMFSIRWIDLLVVGSVAQFYNIGQSSFLPDPHTDSKILSEERRDELFEALCRNKDLLGWKVDILSPNSISNAMLQRCVGEGSGVGVLGGRGRGE